MDEEWQLRLAMTFDEVFIYRHSEMISLEVRLVIFDNLLYLFIDFARSSDEFIL